MNKKDIKIGDLVTFEDWIISPRASPHDTLYGVVTDHDPSIGYVTLRTEYPGYFTVNKMSTQLTLAPVKREHATLVNVDD